MTASSAVDRVFTDRLVLRRPAPEDLASLLALQSDSPPDEGSDLDRDRPRWSAGEFEELPAVWAADGFGPWVAAARESGAPLGVAGVRRAGPGRLDLHVQFGDRAEPGLSIQAARAVVATATEWLPGRVEAVVADHDEPARRVLRAAGLLPLSPAADDAAGEAGTRFAAPTVSRCDRVSDDLRDDLLELWGRVTDAGGSVGFLPGVARERIAATLDAAQQQMADGHAFGMALTEPDGTLTGWAWWIKTGNPLLAHGRWLSRLMIDPSRQGRNLGAVLMAAAHREARADGAELLQLGYRSGSGLGDFYARFGYREVGRIPGAIRVAPGDDRDDVTMVRCVDGGQPTGDGRH